MGSLAPNYIIAQTNADLMATKPLESREQILKILIETLKFSMKK